MRKHVAKRSWREAHREAMREPRQRFHQGKTQKTVPSLLPVYYNGEMDSFELTLNGERVQVRGVDPQTTLLNFLRQSGRTGTKEGCAEGDCGACTVALLDRDAHGRTTYRAINSCIALLPMFAGREVITAEGLAREGVLHPVQSAMVENYGSQCGYCTPGFVMSMFEGYNRADLGTPGSSEENAKIGDQLNGNLCRCTGYRPFATRCWTRWERSPRVPPTYSNFD